MADSTAMDVSKMKVTELRKELKSRGLSHTGDKAELTARLQAAISQDDHGDINLDSDEIDSDAMLEDDDKSQTDILDEAAVETLHDDLALVDQQPPVPSEVDVKPPRVFKRKKSDKSNGSESKQDNLKEPGVKKIVLNRALSVTSISKPPDTAEKPIESNISNEKEKIKEIITADVDPMKKMEMRAKRFGLPIKMSEAERKEARRMRFGQNISTVTAISNSNTPSLAENMDKLKKRAERFGQSVSKIMTDIENKERLEKRKAKFGSQK